MQVNEHARGALSYQPMPRVGGYYQTSCLPAKILTLFNERHLEPVYSQGADRADLFILVN